MGINPDVIDKSSRKLLRIYMNDHLTGASAGIQLARRAMKAVPDGDRDRMRVIVDEIRDDRRALRALMQSLGLRRKRVRAALAAVATRFGAIKPNGRLIRRSPLSDVIELEGLCLGITGKLELWRTLENVLGTDNGSFDFGALAERAKSQRRRVENFRRKAMQRAF